MKRNKKTAKTHPWNKGKVVGKKPPLTPDQVRLVKLRLQEAGLVRDLAMFALAIDSKLRGVDLVALKTSDVLDRETIKTRSSIRQLKTGDPVSFELTPETRKHLLSWIKESDKQEWDDLFTGLKRNRFSAISPRQYRYRVKVWMGLAGLDPKTYGSHSLRRTKASLIYKTTGNLRAVQKLLGHKSIQHTQEYLGIEEDEALEISERIKL